MKKITIKNWKQFNENVNSIDSGSIEQYLQDLIDISDKIHDMTGEDDNHQKFNELLKTKDFRKIYNRWVSLIEEIKDYYKTQLQSKVTESEIRSLHKEIVDFLQQDNYEEYTGVIRFDITDFTRSLIEKISKT